MNDRWKDRKLQSNGTNWDYLTLVCLEEKNVSFFSFLISIQELRALRCILRAIPTGEFVCVSRDNWTSLWKIEGLHEFCGNFIAESFACCFFFLKLWFYCLFIRFGLWWGDLINHKSISPSSAGVLCRETLRLGVSEKLMLSLGFLPLQVPKDWSFLMMTSISLALG